MTMNPDAGLPMALDPSAPTPFALECDVEKYCAELNIPELTEQQQRELILALWSIMRSFVDRAFGDDAAQLCLKGGDECNVADEAGRAVVVQSASQRDQQKPDGLSPAFREKSGPPRKEWP